MKKGKKIEKEMESRDNDRIRTCATEVIRFRV